MNRLNIVNIINVKFLFVLEGFVALLCVYFGLLFGEDVFSVRISSSSLFFVILSQFVKPKQ